MMMSCPVQPALGPASLFFGTAPGEMDAAGAPPQPLFPGGNRMNGGGNSHNSQSNIGGVLGQQPQHQAPGAWFFQQAPEGFDGAGLGGGDDGMGPMPPQAVSPPPGSLAHQQLLARFGPRHSTESVEVPSSEHVAEIVGRQGCKIKALRAKTNTYIKTPVRGEEPVFVVTGRHEDVVEAKREIECAAEHFTQIRASRRHSQGGCPAPGHVTAYVRVPLRVVGLVVGPKGNTIKRIQQDTHTYIITPSRDREPIFEVTGLPQNVEAARREIEQHIYQRTGNMPITDPSASIANYDLHAAALQAQHAAMNASTGNRPNYGALAVTSSATAPRQQQHPEGSGPVSGPFQPYLQQFRPNNGTTKILGLSPSDLRSAHDAILSQQQQHFMGTQSKLASDGEVEPLTPRASLVASASANNLPAMLSAMDLNSSRTGTGQGPVGGEQRQAQQSQQHLLALASTKLMGGGDCSAALLLRSASSGGAPSSSGAPRFVAPGTVPGSAFSPWGLATGLPSGPSGTLPPSGDFLGLFGSSSSASPSPLFSSSSGTGSLPGVGTGGLSSVNSTSRDEGLGDSPTNSFGRPHGSDPYQHLMTIWADVCETSPGGKCPGEEEEVDEGKEEDKMKKNGGGHMGMMG